ncbi:hypothetical protein L3Q82_011897 [Scortum barcoo]|uniref:Uncharacterized protein n=1 Tax=Scortum barcoo TaxID=214431 RepID=A0ACB8W5I3_9TELE|nr:hypothetical protein L3Q82_011897 [Scortum barcoo]
MDGFKDPLQLLQAAQHITRTELPSMEDLYTQQCRKKANMIIKDPNHSSHRLLCLEPTPAGSGTASSPKQKDC